jgi:hypothetical protein
LYARRILENDEFRNEQTKFHSIGFSNNSILGISESTLKERRHMGRGFD